MMYDRSGESSPSGTARTATARRPAKVTKKTNAQAATGGSANANPQKKKKPQNKYEPDVPMTKEAAAAWRREQRRKRNRESAAKSRQRQRDRTVELEAELGEWKAKFSAVMDRLNAAEAARGIVPSTPSDLPISKEIRVESATGSTDTTNGTTVPTDPTAAAPHQGSPSTSNETQQQQKHHLIETISRPAVKITGDASSLSPTSSALYLPDAATSMTMMPAADDEGPPDLVAASPAVPTIASRLFPTWSNPPSGSRTPPTSRILLSSRSLPSPPPEPIAPPRSSMSSTFLASPTSPICRSLRQGTTSSVISWPIGSKKWIVFPPRQFF